MPIVLAVGVNAVTIGSPEAYHRLTVQTVVFFVMLLLSIPVNSAYYRLLSHVQRAVEFQLRSVIRDRLNLLSIGFLGRNSNGVLQNKIIHDVEAVGNFTRTVFDCFLSCGINIVAGFVVTAIYQPKSILYFGALVPITLALTLVFHKPLRRHAKRHHGAMEDLAKETTNMLAILPLARAHAAETRVSERLSQHFEQVQNTGKESDRAIALFGAFSWVSFQSCYVLTFVAAIFMASKGIFKMSGGDVVLLSAYFLTITNSVLAVISMWPGVTGGVQAIESVSQLFRTDEIERHSGKRPVTDVSGRIQFQSVSFEYPRSGFSAISDLSFDIAQGEVLALIGPSGAGKSTVTKLILGLVNPQSGRVLVDGQDLAECDLTTFRKYVSVVPQEPVFFNSSIRDNLLFGNPSATDEQLRQALIDANAWEFVSQLPEGMNTHLGEKGSRFSGGQRQRISIAAAILRNPKILVLDEATSALDMQCEELIQSSLRKILPGRTTIIIAHRPSTLKLATRFLFLENGQMVRQFMSQKGFEAGTASIDDGLVQLGVTNPGLLF